MKKHGTTRSCLASLLLGVPRTGLSQLWRSGVGSIHYLDHLLDVLSDFEPALGCTFFAAFGMLWPISQAQQDPDVDLAAILATALCCSARR